jgi:hypothetical protein
MQLEHGGNGIPMSRFGHGRDPYKVSTAIEMTFTVETHDHPEGTHRSCVAHAPVSPGVG